MLDDGEAKAGAAGVARPRFVDAIESFEYALQMLGSNARTKVLDEKFNFILEQTSAD